MTISKKCLSERIIAFESAVRAGQLKMTDQRRAVYRAVAAVETHPTAEAVWRAVRRRQPDVSFATVYRNLGQLRDLGLILELRPKDGQVRFDANCGTHGHLVNLKTGAIRDVPLIGRPPRPRGIRTADIRHTVVIFYVAGE
ncbi:hypothetical protein A3C96_01855 [Candidatus Uhrbacteria bacterium RIFCSPHIGHO2_02_FULL_60_10]|uniref:Transcriptional repressor n=1 Tax=Candidatus Uhrbacteria bacterium RIFCSPHIGHO2_02_FULL_60_10 TaxID=1802392 RepID=A0A1F7UA50_9BACT|nr:MAG: hypothetical protein A3C96_01855 [Candidatus Uhrbacteria bacterium RIFCSPHIGHO2_02_FULL_60_10]